MEYIKTLADGYIIAVQNNAPPGTGNCTEQEYQSIMAAIKTAPEAPDGYGVRLRDDLTWETYELPQEEPEAEEATEADYQVALEEMGCSFDAES